MVLSQIFDSEFGLAVKAKPFALNHFGYPLFVRVLSAISKLFGAADGIIVISKMPVGVSPQFRRSEPFLFISFIAISICSFFLFRIAFYPQFGSFSRIRTFLFAILCNPLPLIFGLLFLCLLWGSRLFRRSRSFQLASLVDRIFVSMVIRLRQIASFLAIVVRPSVLNGLDGFRMRRLPFDHVVFVLFAPLAQVLFAVHTYNLTIKQSLGKA